MDSGIQEWHREFGNDPWEFGNSWASPQENGNDLGNNRNGLRNLGMTSGIWEWQQEFGNGLGNSWEFPLWDPGIPRNALRNNGNGPSGNWEQPRKNGNSPQNTRNCRGNNGNSLGNTGNGLGNIGNSPRKMGIPPGIWELPQENENSPKKCWISTPTNSLEWSIPSFR